MKRILLKIRVRAAQFYDTVRNATRADLKYLNETTGARGLDMRYHCCELIYLRGIRHGSLIIWLSAQLHFGNFTDHLGSLFGDGNDIHRNAY